MSKLDDEGNGGLAKWDEAQEKWIIPRVDLAGNNYAIKAIPSSVKGAFRPETEFSHHCKLNKNSIHNHNNILELNLDYPNPVSINHTGPNASNEIRIDVNKSYNEVMNTCYLWDSNNKVLM